MLADFGILGAAQTQKGLKGDVKAAGALAAQDITQSADFAVPIFIVSFKMRTNLRHSDFIPSYYALLAKKLSKFETKKNFLHFGLAKFKVLCYNAL